MIAVIDLDTILIKSETSIQDYDVFPEYKPHKLMIALTSALYRAGVEVLIVSDFNFRLKFQIQAWLDKHGAKYTQLKLRHTSPTVQSKYNLLSNLNVDDILCVLSNETFIINKLKSLNIVCLQA